MRFNVKIVKHFRSSSRALRVAEHRVEPSNAGLLEKTTRAARPVVVRRVLQVRGNLQLAVVSTTLGVRPISIYLCNPLQSRFVSESKSNSFTLGRHYLVIGERGESFP